jgi:outer membrane murein-binding lipoprotein Lpp
MRNALITATALVTLTFAGCHSEEQKQADLTAAYQTANSQYQKDCSATPTDQDANAIVGAALGSKPSPQQQTAIDQHQHEAEVRKTSPHCKELDENRDSLTRQMLLPQSK